MQLRVLQTTDLHMQIFPYDYFNDQPIENAGLSKAAMVIEDLRRNSKNSLLFDNGDVIQGNPMGDFIALERSQREKSYHPIVEAMNIIGYDAATLGNHDFNYGLEFLRRSMKGANHPIVLANVATKLGSNPTEDETLFDPFCILDRVVIDADGNPHDLKIGVIGFVPPQITNWDHKHLSGNVYSRDIIETAQAFVPSLKAAGADIVIALSHSGIGSDIHIQDMENASVPLAAVDGIDAILTGHIHLVFPGLTIKQSPAIDPELGRLHGKPAIMAGFGGSHVGVIDLELEIDNGRWRVSDHCSYVMPVLPGGRDDPVGEHKAITSACKDIHEETLEHIRKDVGRATAPIHSYFAMLGCDPTVQIVNAAQSWYVENAANDEAKGYPLLSATSPFRAGGLLGIGNFTHIAKGPLALRHIADLYPFPNMLHAVLLNGADIRNWLEQSASIFNQVTSGTKDIPLLNPGAPSYNFDVISGIHYQIDLSQPARFDVEGEITNKFAQRIVNPTFQGQPLQDEMKFVVATNSYRTGGGGGFSAARYTNVVLDAPDTNRDVVSQFVQQNRAISPRPSGNWSLVAERGAACIFKTSPKARKFLHDLSHLNLTDLGDDPDGFASFRIAF